MGAESYYQNRECPYFPCHPGADPENFSCQFCFCPLYLLGKNCGGSFTVLPNGVKDCTGCLRPHLRENRDALLRRLAEASKNMSKTEKF